ncbi:MAG: Rne/Rng family ribonuclease [Candidatus Omnitrophica bacterium]|nr:Rne/Rng family ribonuclease [Candidatus Omnitrophota bacterium]
MYQEILITCESQEKRVAILEGRSLEEFYVERQGAQRSVGNIYKGVVNSIVPGIGAAFVNIGLEKNGFLYVQDLTLPDYEKIAELVDRSYVYEGAIANNNAKRQPDIKDMLKMGQEIMVQLVKEPLGTKGARLTTNISLPGRYLVLMPQASHVGISRRIQDNKERQRLRELLKGIKLPPNMGMIVRTAGCGANKREFLQDLRYLMGLWRKIRNTFNRKTAPSLAHEEYDLVLRVIRDSFTAQANRLLVDSKQEYKRIMHFLNIVAPSLKNRVHYYTQDVPLFEKKGVEDEIAKIHDRKVNLKSGGYITIDPTEALVAIDVNSGRFTRKKDPEETATMVNLEAAREIARQVRLRDIGGIIIIDFIDMKSRRNRNKVLDTLSSALKRDHHAKTDISNVSELGLVEMTRQRVRKSLESVVYQTCSYCQGRGLVKSSATMSIMALRKIKKVLQTNKKKTILVFAHPEVASYLVNEHRLALAELENKFRAKVLIKQDTGLHVEKLTIEPV